MTSHRPDIRNPFRTAARVSLAMTLVLLAAAAILIFVGRDWFHLASEIGAVVGVLSVGPMISFGICWLFARRINRFIAAIRSDDLLARWSYSTVEWQRFLEGHEPFKRAFLRRDLLALTGLAGLVLLVFGGLIAHDIYVGEAVSWNSLVIAVGVVVVVFGMLAGIRVCMAARERRRLRDHAAQPPESHFGRDFTYANGEFIALNWGAQFLVGATLVEAYPPVIEMAMSNSDTGAQGKRVLVPAGHEAEAEQVVATLRKTILTPR